MIKPFAVGAIAAFFVLLPGLTVSAAERPLPAGARIIDSNMFLYGRPYPTISPDGRSIAYVSQGYVCVSNIEDPAPQRIKEVPGSATWPGFQAPAGRLPATGNYPTLARGLERDESSSLRAQLRNTIEGFNWTRKSDGFVFGVTSFDEKTRTSFGSGYLASVDGKLAPLSKIEPDSPTRGLVVGDFTEDRRYFVGRSMLSVGANRWGQLIWDIKQKRPRATPYLHLVPSSTSGRWIGIEKDTRQLVLLDEELQVARRFDEWLPDRTFGFQLDWSPDERFIIWRNQIGFDHYSNWEGFRLDLKTREKRPLEGRFMKEQIQFTGRGSEFVRCGRDGVRGKWSGDLTTGAHLTIVPDGFAPPRDIWRFLAGPDRQIGELFGPSALHLDPDAILFLISLPRFESGRVRFAWHSIDRSGKAWRLPGDDTDEFETPYSVAGFAAEGRLIVGYDQTRLFTIPVASIKQAANEVELAE